jgi:hypothetical protein
MSKLLSDDYLLAYSEEHIVYEIRMFFWLAIALDKRKMKVAGKSEADPLHLRFALIEAFVIHLRNLIEFLFINYPKDKHIVAAQFCPEGAWINARPALSEALKTAWGRADKEMAHLTTERIPGRPKEKEWEFTGLAEEVAPLLRVLVGAAEVRRLSSVVAKTLDDYEKSKDEKDGK